MVTSDSSFRAAPLYRIPRLVSGGIMLTYRCSNACRHCLYRCSPGLADDLMSEDMIDRVFETLAHEPGLAGIHLAGGEAGLAMDRLEYAVRSALAHGIRVDYLETNAYWCNTLREARHGFERLKTAGLSAVLISASLFHNEFVPLERTCHAIRAAEAVFGQHGVIVYTRDVLQLMKAHLAPDRTHTIRESSQLLGLAPDRGDLWRLHSYLIPGGRAAEVLTAGLERYPAAHFQNARCDQDLQNTSHFHITPDGSLFTGLCGGIAAGTLEDLHPHISAEETPLFDTLCRSGPHGLCRLAEGDFHPDPEGYVSKCHLCLEVRKALHARGGYRELSPDAFYG